MTSKEMRKALRNPATSFWLSRSLDEADKRDCVDALNDASILREYLEKVCDEAMENVTWGR